MVNRKKERFVEPWQSFAWRMAKWYKPPGPPSKDDLAIYRRYFRQIFSKKKGIKALILGSTPQLRDLLHELKAEVTIIDISFEMILTMTQSLEKAKPGEEVWVNANWLSNPLADNYFEIILGDIVLENIPTPLQPKFFQELRRLLKPGGYWLAKFEVVPDNWQVWPLPKTLAYYAHLPYRENRFEELFCHLLADTFNPKKTDSVSSKRIFRRLKKYFKNNQWYHPDKKVQRLLRQMWQMWQPFDKVWSQATTSAIQQKVSRYFEILVKDQAKDYLLSETMPIWLMKVKK